LLGLLSLAQPYPTQTHTTNICNFTQKKKQLFGLKKMSTFFQQNKKKKISMLSIAYFSLQTIFCKIGYIFFPSQVHIFFLGRIANVCSAKTFQNRLGFGQKMLQFDPTQPNPRKTLVWVWARFFGPNPTCLHPDIQYSTASTFSLPVYCVVFTIIKPPSGFQLLFRNSLICAQQLCNTPPTWLFDVEYK
jgi:hypothetical protein